MSYTCYLDGVVIPTPGKLTVKVKNKNKTLILLNAGEINFLRTPGLTELAVSLTLPMLTGDRPPDFYLSLLKRLKNGKAPTRFMLVRTSPGGSLLFDTNLWVSVEDYNIVEDAKEGLDVSVDISLKQWRSYGTKTVEVEQTKTASAITVAKERDASTAPAAKIHTVESGDTLWALAAKYYGSGAQYTKIFHANKGVISNPNVIYAGWVLTIP